MIFLVIVGISADLFTPADNVFESAEVEPENKCYCPGNEFCPPKGLQNISPCQFGNQLKDNYSSLQHKSEGKKFTNRKLIL